jgi:hypothetical protein
MKRLQSGSNVAAWIERRQRTDASSLTHSHSSFSNENIGVPLRDVKRMHTGLFQGSRVRIGAIRVRRALSRVCAECHAPSKCPVLGLQLDHSLRQIAVGASELVELVVVTGPARQGHFASSKEAFAPRGELLPRSSGLTCEVGQGLPAEQSEHELSLDAGGALTASSFRSRATHGSCPATVAPLTTATAVTIKPQRTCATRLVTRRHRPSNRWIRAPSTTGPSTNS